MKQPSTLWDAAMSAYCSGLASYQRVQNLREMLNIWVKDEDTHAHPQKKIPNVRTFRVSLLSPVHPIFAEKDIFKRQFEPLIEQTPYINHSQNKYIRQQFTRLNNARNDPKIFWTIGSHLLHRSSSFLSLCLYEVFPGWHKKYSYGKIWNYLRSVRKLNLFHYQYRRHQIPKTNGKMRTLGIPTPAWRIYLRGLQHLLVIWFSPYSHPNQHGFQPSKGTDTAWLQIHREVLKSSNIYEFDLKNYFGSINLTYLDHIMRALGLPRRLSDLITHWNRMPPENPGPLEPWPDEKEEAEDYQYYVTEEFKLLSPEEVNHWLKRKRHHEERRPEIKDCNFFRGVSAGSPISPIISTLPITKDLLINPLCKVCQYADDGIIYDFTGNPLDFLTFPPASRICINREKSQWLKKDGYWLEPLKFLGKKFTFTNNPLPHTQGGILENSTRNSKKFLFDQHELIMKAANYDSYLMKNDGKFPSSFMEWFETKYYGFVSSRIYAGNFDLTDIQQDFTYKFVRWSWSDLHEKRSSPRMSGRREDVKMTTFNSSSFACKSISNRIKAQLPRKVFSFLSKVESPSRTGVEIESTADTIS